jgi:rhodanese-related sulfurtransferase
VAFVLLHNGFKHVYALKGGYNAWVDAGGATVRRPPAPHVKAAHP